MSTYRSGFFPGKLLGCSTFRTGPLVVGAVFVLLIMGLFTYSSPPNLFSVIEGERFGQHGRVYATEEWEPPPEWDSTEAVYNNFPRSVVACYDRQWVRCMTNRQF